MLITLFAEPRHVSTDGEFGSVSVTSTGTLSRISVCTEPILTVMAVHKSLGLKQLVGTARDQVINLLRRLDKRVAKGESWRRRLTRSHGRRCRSPKLRKAINIVRVTMLQDSPDISHFKRLLDFGEGQR